MSRILDMEDDMVEMTLTDKRRGPMLRIVRNGLNDCEARLGAMRRDKSEAARLGHTWLPKSIPMQMYREAQRLVRQEQYVLRSLRLQLEVRKETV